MNKHVAAATLLCLAAAPQAVAGCLSYGDRLTLTGKLIRQTFPGPPNFESIKDGDKPETGWYLILNRPLCMASGESPLTEAPQAAVRRVQLILTAEQYQTERGRLDQRVTVTGEPWSEHTGHHHAPVLLSGVEFQ